MSMRHHFSHMSPDLNPVGNHQDVLEKALRSISPIIQVLGKKINATLNGNKCSNFVYQKDATANACRKQSLRLSS